MVRASEVNSNEYNPYYGNYITSLGETELIQGLKENLEQTVSFFQSIPDSKLDAAYEKGKWTVKQVFQHIIDTERIFSYRALAFSRNDSTDLPGFEQDDYMTNVNTALKTKSDFLEEYKAVRNASIIFFKSLPNEALSIIGKASGSSMSARAAGFMIIGHERHHFNVIKENYLS